jgi:hypothetical protein
VSKRCTNVSCHSLLPLPRSGTHGSRSKRPTGSGHVRKSKFSEMAQSSQNPKRVPLLVSAPVSNDAPHCDASNKSSILAAVFDSEVPLNHQPDERIGIVAEIVVGIVNRAAMEQIRAAAVLRRATATTVRGIPTCIPACRCFTLLPASALDPGRTDQLMVKVSATIESLRVRDVMAANVMAAELMPTAVDRVRAHSLTLLGVCYSAGAKLCGKTPG